MSRAAARALSLAALAALSACVRAPPPDLSRNPEALLEQVRAAQDRIASCKGNARVSVSSRELDGSLDAWVAASVPGRVHLEIFDFFGNPAAILVAGEGRFALYDAQAGVVYRGEDTPENLARLVPVPIGAGPLSRLLCGGAPILEGRPVSAEPGEGVLLLELAGPGGRQVLAVGEGAVVRSTAWLPGPRGGVAWKAAFSVFRHAAGTLVPTDVELRGGGAEIALHWRDDRETNAPLDERLFRLETPKGARVVELARGARPPPLDLPIRPATPSRP